MGWAACRGERMFQLSVVGWSFSPCKHIVTKENGASPDWIIVLVAAAAVDVVVVVRT